VAGTVPGPAAVLVVAVVGGLGAVLLGVGGVAAALLAAVAAAWLVRVARRRLGGITGDVLGAVVEVATAVALVAVALAAA
jgi:adenosylcobinamide-GDP ribazoletransferase